MRGTASGGSEVSEAFLPALWEKDGTDGRNHVAEETKTYSKLLSRL